MCADPPPPSGYAGELSAAVALDTVVNDASAVLIDIRPAREKEASGVPDVPGAASSKVRLPAPNSRGRSADAALCAARARNPAAPRKAMCWCLSRRSRARPVQVLEVEFAALEDKKLRSQLKDPSFIEAQTTALQIASLRRIGTGSKVILLDRYGPLAQAVARELNRKGYNRVFVVGGGFDGRAGWIQSKLQIKPFTSTALTFSAPAFGRTGTTSTRRLPAPRL
jgi:rhodanese-related sulfurtransferase